METICKSAKPLVENGDKNKSNYKPKPNHDFYKGQKLTIILVRLSSFQNQMLVKIMYRLVQLS